MKFNEIKYERPDIKKVKEELSHAAARLNEADSYEKARDAFIDVDRISKHVQTAGTLVSIRHSIDTRDEFYDSEMHFWNAAMPELEQYLQEFGIALLRNKYRKDFENEFGELMLLNREIQTRSFSPKIISKLQKENDLVQEYDKLIASAQIKFEGGTYTLAQMTPFKTHADDDVRLRAWKAEGQWFKDNQPELDRIYDELVKLRDSMGRELGYDGFTELGYYRMVRNCYDKSDVEKFRNAVVKYVVPIAGKLYEKQAESLGKQYPMSFADNELSFRSGNPRPAGTSDDIIKAGKKFYDELSNETSEFFNMMIDNELMDVLAKPGKAGGGYCTDLADYEVPFIFANFNGTQGDVEVVTHEAGHAFASYMNRDRIPHEYCWPSLEACEVHSMSMEFFAWPWSEDFFGPDSDKFRYSHLCAALKFIPYGTMVDHFQHEVYEHPEMTPAQRHDTWKRLLGIYEPWVRLDGEIPFYSEGQGWQRQSHIYDVPFYYIDYCLAQTVSLEFWAMLMNDFGDAWKHYMTYTKMGGSKVFTELLSNSGMESPFEEETLRKVCETASKWLDEFDTDKLK